MDSAQDSYKKWGVILIVFLLILIPSEIALMQPNALNNLKGKLGLVSEPKQIPGVGSSETSTNSTSVSTAYFVQLEYDPLTKTATEVGKGAYNGASDELSSSPSASESKFSYKIETSASSGKILASGWVSRSKFVISTKEGKYLFHAYVTYVPGESLTISSIDNRVLWSGKVI